MTQNPNFESFWARNGFHMSREVPECTEIHLEVTRDILCINKVDQYHLEWDFIDLEPPFSAKITVLSHFGPEMKVDRLFKGPDHTEIHSQVIRGIQYVNKFDQYY